MSCAYYSFVTLTGASENCANVVEVFFSNVLFFNYMEGTIPGCLWNMSKLATLHLNANGFSGKILDIPSESSLVDVRLSHNRLTGTIPLSVQRKQFQGISDIHCGYSCCCHHWDF